MSARSSLYESAARKRMARRAWRYALKSGTVGAIAFAIESAYSAGYHDGHESCMQARIRDAQCHEKNGRHL